MFCDPIQNGRYIQLITRDLTAYIRSYYYVQKQWTEDMKAESCCTFVWENAEWQMHFPEFRKIVYFIRSHLE